MTMFMLLGGPRDGDMLDLDDSTEQVNVPVQPGVSGAYVRQAESGKKVLVWEYLRGQHH
jgi:hypothetical protein